MKFYFISMIIMITLALVLLIISVWALFNHEIAKSLAALVFFEINGLIARGYYSDYLAERSKNSGNGRAIPLACHSSHNSNFKQ